jgi:hypothetical protein
MVERFFVEPPDKLLMWSGELLRANDDRAE